jgi:mRNA interferase RelE/StbE
MKVYFKSSFVRDFKKLPSDILDEVYHVCIDIFPELGDIRDFHEYRIKSLRGFRNYYRIRLGNYRIGFKRTKDGDIEFMRVKHRKDIYKHFP